MKTVGLQAPFSLISKVIDCLILSRIKLVHKEIHTRVTYEGPKGVIYSGLEHSHLYLFATMPIPLKKHKHKIVILDEVLC